MAKVVMGSKRFVLLRGKNEDGGDIVIDMFSKKELDTALREGRIEEKDHVVQVEVLGRVDLKRPRRSRKA